MTEIWYPVLCSQPDEATWDGILPLFKSIDVHQDKICFLT